MKTWYCYDSAWNFVVQVSAFNIDAAYDSLSEEDKEQVRYMRELAQ